MQKMPLLLQFLTSICPARHPNPEREPRKNPAQVLPIAAASTLTCHKGRADQLHKLAGASKGFQ
jgi:hypothetical protein